MTKVLPVLFLAFGGALVFGGALSCPDGTYVTNPIVGATGGTVTSCGNANVFATEAFAATPGDGSVPVSVLQSYLGHDLSGVVPFEYEATEGSAVMFAGFTAGAGATLSFDWSSAFEEGGVGSLFYILNGGLTVIESILPDGQGLPGSLNSGSVTLNLLAGENTFAFGAVSVMPLLGRQAPFDLADPQLNVLNMAVKDAGVPEPGTYALVGLALAGLALRRRY